MFFHSFWAKNREFKLPKPLRGFHTACTSITAITTLRQSQKSPYVLSYFVSIMSLDSTHKSCVRRTSWAFNLNNDIVLHYTTSGGPRRITKGSIILRPANHYILTLHTLVHPTGAALIKSNEAPAKLTTANGGTFTWALLVSVANHVTARSIGDWRALTWLATATGWTRRKRSAICSGKLISVSTWFHTTKIGGTASR